jgi:hypothetical protein
MLSAVTSRADGVRSPEQAFLTYSVPKQQSSGHIPTTRVVGVPLANTALEITAMWQAIRGSKVVIDSLSTLARTSTEA